VTKETYKRQKRPIRDKKDLGCNVRRDLLHKVITSRVGGGVCGPFASHGQQPRDRA
jgi:hypothetical protein